MKQASPEVVLRQLRLDAGAALLARGRPAAQVAPACDPVADAMRSGYEEGLRSGHQEGLRQGYEQGRNQGALAAQAAAQERAQAQERDAAQRDEQHALALRNATAAIEQATRELAAAAEDDMVLLCLETVARVFGETARDRNSVGMLVRTQLAQWRGAPPLAIHLHPGDLALLREAGAMPDIDCVADPQLESGGCILRGTQGALDARLDRVLDAVRQALLAARSTRQAGVA